MTYLISQIRDFIVLHSGYYTQTRRAEGGLPGGAERGGEGAGCSYSRILPDYMVYRGSHFWVCIIIVILLQKLSVG